MGAGKDPVCAMGWLRIDDGFEDHAKVELLSNDAHRLWMRAACWCRKTANQHTDGRVPRALLSVIAKRMASPSKLTKLAQELVDANGGGEFQFGLWELDGDGWRFHDWDKYQPEPDVKTPMSRSEAARIAGERSAEVRRERFGTAQPGSVNDARTIPERSDDVRPNDVPRTPRTTSEPPIPGPLPPPDPMPIPSPTDQIHTRDPDPGSATFGKPAAPKTRARDRFAESFDPIDQEDQWAFERWQTECGKPGSRLDPKRAECLRGRREGGMTRQDVDDVLLGAKADDWAKEVGFKVTCLFGDPERYEGFRDAGRAIRRGEAPVKSKRGIPQPKQPNSGYQPPVEDA